MAAKEIFTGLRKLAPLLLVLVAVASLLASATARTYPVFNSADSRIIAVEVIPVAELPLIVSEVTLTKMRNGYVLKCLLSNNAADQIVRLDYLLLVMDSNNVERHLVNGTEDFRLKGYATMTLISQTPLRLEVSDDYRLFLMPHRVFTRDSGWEVLKAKKALAAHASGDYSVTPEVVRALNLFDAPPRPRIIY